jgi:hypothetical protein
MEELAVSEREKIWKYGILNIEEWNIGILGFGNMVERSVFHY